MTPSSPVVSTGDTVKVTINSIEIFGTIESIGLTATESITEYGHCWSSTIYAPTVYNDRTKHESRTDTCTYTSTLTNLKPNTTYYIRAYAINEADTGYGNTKMFKTLNDKPPTKPFLSTTIPTDVTKNSARSGCLFFSDLSIFFWKLSPIFWVYQKNGVKAWGVRSEIQNLPNGM